MPGGSVNGRPFREGADSYSKTGIPCGDPKRFQSREVIKMGMQNQRALSEPLAGPVEEIETEKDRQLQNLLQKQLNTNMTIHEHFRQHKTFSDGVYHKSATDSLSGTVSLTDFKGLSHLDGYIIELKHCGLTEEEIELKLEDSGCTKSKKLRLNLEPRTRENKLKAIDEKISQKRKELEKADKFAGAKTMGRHEMDLERAISQNTDRSKLLNCLLTSSNISSPHVVSEDPMDHLPEILDSLTKQGKRKKNTCRKRVHSDKDRQDEDVSAVHHFVADDEKNYHVDSDNNHKSKSLSEERALSRLLNSEDKKTCADESRESGLCELDTHPVTCTCTNSDGNSNLRSLTGKLAFIPEEDIVRDRLSLTEIQSLDRFKNYTAGEPSQVLYLKNLPGKVCEEDLVRLFIRFQKKDGPPIVFKLMKGRMRGQAFLTFDSTDTATEALQLVNGYNFKGKPIIIQYGRSPPADS